MKKLVILLAIVVFTVLMAGCSGSTPTAKSDSVVENIKKTKVLTVGTDATFKPFEYKNNGKYEGFDIELIQAVAKELGADKVEYVDTEFKGLIPGLLAKKYDVIVSAMYITDARKQTINFSESYFPGGLSVMVRKDDNNIHSVNDLKGKKVSVQVGTKSAKYLEEKYPDVTLVKVETNNEMFLELETGKVDAVVTGLPAAKTYAKEKGTVKVLSDTLTEEFYGYGLRKEDEELTKAMNAALKKVKDNGTYAKIEKKWFE